jgi:hypothetical protein
MDSLNGYGSSLLGTLTVAVLAGAAWCVKNKLKHSECALDSKCLKIRSHEDDETRNTIRRELMDELRREGFLMPPPVMVPRRGELSASEEVIEVGEQMV